MEQHSRVIYIGQLKGQSPYYLITKRKLRFEQSMDAELMDQIDYDTMNDLCEDDDLDWDYIH